MKGDLWLAVGDETGSWNDLADPKQFLGAAIVMGKLSDWESALKETFKEQTIEQRLKQPLQSLSNGDTNKKHRIIDAFNYFKAQSVRGRWALDRMVKGDSPIATLKNELCTNLGWLATHPLLITIGTYGNAEWVKDKLQRTQENDVVTLGRAYGLLATLMIPFLKEEDHLLVALNGAKNFPIEEESESYLKDLTSGLENYTQQSLRVWQRTKMAALNSGTFMDLQQNYLKDTPLDEDVLLNIADLGAALVGLSQNQDAQIRIYDSNKSWHNVKLFKFEELLS
jgi:hypothetical protein